MPYATSMGHLDCITVLNFLCLPPHTSAGMGPKPIVLPNLPTKYSHKNSSDFTLSSDFPFPVCTHEHKSSCRSETKMQQTPFNRGKQRRKKLGDYSQYSIPDLSTSSLQSCARPPVTNQHEIDSGSTFSQVDLCISFCPNSCLRQ
jgi:hypothetical protein